MTIIGILIACFLAGRLIATAVQNHKKKPDDGMTPDERVAAFNASQAKR